MSKFPGLIIPITPQARIKAEDLCASNEVYAFPNREGLCAIAGLEPSCSESELHAALKEKGFEYYTEFTGEDRSFFHPGFSTAPTERPNSVS
jgi:hypothetical protein